MTQLVTVFLHMAQQDMRGCAGEGVTKCISAIELVNAGVDMDFVQRLMYVNQIIDFAPMNMLLAHWN